MSVLVELPKALLSSANSLTSYSASEFWGEVLTFEVVRKRRGSGDQRTVTVQIAHLDMHLMHDLPQEKLGQRLHRTWNPKNSFHLNLVRF